MDICSIFHNNLRIVQCVKCEIACTYTIITVSLFYMSYHQTTHFQLLANTISVFIVNLEYYASIKVFTTLCWFNAGTTNGWFYLMIY